MTAVELWTRNAAPVEALHLTTLRELHAAEEWLRAHGVETAHRHPALTRRGLLVPTGPGQFTAARLGQWVVRDTTTGTWAVVDGDQFQQPSYTPRSDNTTEAAR